MADLLVDLSNVCRDERLGGSGRADWARLDRLLEHWHAYVNSHSDVLLIADQSLSRGFRTPQARTRWQELSASGQLISVPNADEELLRRARETGASVLSRDGFVGHRRRHDWVQGDAEHFWRWRVDSDGSLSIALTQMTIAGDYTVTRESERDQLKASGFETRDFAEGLLAEVYRCTTPGCPESVGDLLPGMPAMAAGRAICPTCHRPLTSRGARPPARRLRLLVGGGEADAVHLAEGQQVTVGRGHGPARWNVDDAVASAAHVSRDHAQLSVRGGMVVVEDLGSANGTHVTRWRPDLRGWGPPERLHGAATLLARDRIMLPDNIVIAQSARRYVVPDVL